MQARRFIFWGINLDKTISNFFKTLSNFRNSFCQCSCPNDTNRDESTAPNSHPFTAPATTCATATVPYAAFSAKVPHQAPEHQPTSSIHEFSSPKTPSCPTTTTGATAASKQSSLKASESSSDLNRELDLKEQIVFYDMLEQSAEIKTPPEEREILCELGVGCKQDTEKQTERVSA